LINFFPSQLRDTAIPLQRCNDRHHITEERAQGLDVLLAAVHSYVTPTSRLRLQALILAPQPSVPSDSGSCAAAKLDWFAEMQYVLLHF
jgi:hypothetical protein